MKQGFNLLKPQVEAPNIWTSLYAYITNTARIILIITESAVILALVIRVIVDVQGKDLDGKIKTYESMLTLREPEESKYNILQDKIQTYQAGYESLPAYSNIIKAITDNIPKEFTDTFITVQKDVITISGESQEVYIQKMEEFLKNSDLFIDSKLSTLVIDEKVSTNKVAKFTFTTKIKKTELRILNTNTN